MKIYTLQKKNVGRVSLKNKIIRSLWNMFYLFFFRPFGTRLFRKWRILVLKLWGADVSFSSSVYASTKIWAPWNLILEDNAGIGPNVYIYNQDIVHLKKGAKISQFCYLCTAGHDITLLNNAHNGLIIAPIIINENAWIGTSAYINMGVTIGKGSIVGARSSVFKDVNDFTIVGGNPAQFIKCRELKNE